jgi:UDP-N-acetylmuramoyl-tripeptide--D-alanyl-D-alanine ligase
VLIDDSYNANPGSVSAAIATLAQHANAWLVLGDMAELGEARGGLHATWARRPNDAGLARLCHPRPAQQAKRAEHSAAGALHFDSQQALIDALHRELNAGVRCLVQGSRSSAMDKWSRRCSTRTTRNGHAA